MMMEEYGGVKRAWHRSAWDSGFSVRLGVV